MLDKSWFNSYHLIEDKPQPQPVQDTGLINRAENLFLGGPQDGIYRAIESHELLIGKFQMSPRNYEVASLDVVLAIVSLSKYFKYNFYKRLDIWWHVKQKPSHIRFVPFYLALKYNYCFFLYPIAYLVMLVSVSRTKWINTDRGKVVDVDGKRLVHIQLEGTRSWLRPFFYLILRFKHGNWREFITGEFFWVSPDHPNRKLARGR